MELRLAGETSNKIDKKEKEAHKELEDRKRNGQTDTQNERQRHIQTRRRDIDF